MLLTWELLMSIMENITHNNAHIEFHQLYNEQKKRNTQ